MSFEYSMKQLHHKLSKEMVDKYFFMIEKKFSRVDMTLLGFVHPIQVYHIFYSIYFHRMSCCYT